MKKNAAAVALGSLGGKRAAETMTAAQKRKRALKGTKAAAKVVTQEQRIAWGRKGGLAKAKKNSSLK
jgi:hypothetical protein